MFCLPLNSFGKCFCKLQSFNPPGKKGETLSGDAFDSIVNLMPMCLSFFYVFNRRLYAVTYSNKN